jgi:hypothetical protein
MIYIAMFDEVDEATAIFKCAENEHHVPAGENFLHLGSDGYTLQSDHYLWLSGSAGFLIKQGLPFPETQPRRFPGENISVQRIFNRGALTKTEYGRITMRMEADNSSYLILYKQTDFDAFTPLITLNREQFQGVEYIYNDVSISPGSNYRYIVVAFDADGIPVAISNINPL